MPSRTRTQSRRRRIGRERTHVTTIRARSPYIDAPALSFGDLGERVGFGMYDCPVVLAFSVDLPGVREDARRAYAEYLYLAMTFIQGWTNSP